MWKSCSDHPVDPDDLVTAIDIVERLGLRDVRRVYDWSLVAEFPRPVARGRHRYWYWPEVDLWAAQHHPELQRRDPVNANSRREVR